MRAHPGDTDPSIPVVRAQHLIHYIGVLRDAGVPVERALERSRLPVSIEQTPNDYVSLPHALDWVWRSRREVGIMELGFLAGRAASVGTLHPEVQRALIGAPPACPASRCWPSECIGKTAPSRSTCSTTGRISARFEGYGALRTAPLSDSPSGRWSRGSSTPCAAPQDPTGARPRSPYVSRGRPSDATLEAYGNARILTGHRYCSVLVTAADLAQTCIDRRSAPDPVGHPMAPPQPPSGPGDAWDFVTALRAIIRPYLAQGRPHLPQVAEIVGMSERTLQRRLAQAGVTFSEIVQDARFSIASDLMADTNLNIADIAFAAGYENAPHFSRAFKRLTGMTPREYRCGWA